MVLHGLMYLQRVNVRLFSLFTKNTDFFFMQLKNASDHHMCLLMEKLFETICTIQIQLNSCAIRDTYLLLQSPFGDAVKMENGKIMKEERRIFPLVNVSFKVSYHF